LHAPIQEQLSQLPENLSMEDALTAVQEERRHELFTEYGHRWLDLKRTGSATTVLGAIKPDYWQATDTLFPIPLTDINRNPNLRNAQNEGYN
jgi:hypothetical protein